MHNERNFAFSSDLEMTERADNTQDKAMLMLDENDIPGASLNGREPNELTVVQLKRWLACRGAPLSGKKPELIDRYVPVTFSCFISMYLISISVCRCLSLPLSLYIAI